MSSYFLGFSIAGQYKIVEQVITLYRTFIQVYLKYFFPSVCYKISINTIDGFSYWKKYVSFNFIIVVASLFVMYFFTIPILQFFNVSVENIISLTSIFRFTLIIPLLMALSLYLEQLMFVTNKNKVYIKIAIFVTLVNIFLIVSLLDSLALIGVIVAIAISEILFIVLYFYASYFDLNKKLKI
jgi:O-antigen/teichoic acid export membrane protein